MPETRFITILDFRTPWECDIEVLGQTFEIAIGGQTGKLTLPSLKSDEQQEKLERLLMSPPATLNWKQGGEPIYWGKVVYTQATVDCAVAEFLVETNYPEEIANSIYEAYTDWYALLAKYLMILANSDCQVPGLESTNVDDPYGPYRIGAYTSEKTGRLKRFSHTRKKPIILYVDISGGSQIRFDHLAKACRLALSGLLPRLEYRLLWSIDC